MDLVKLLLAAILVLFVLFNLVLSMIYTRLGIILSALTAIKKRLDVP